MLTSGHRPRFSIGQSIARVSLPCSIASVVRRYRVELTAESEAGQSIRTKAVRGRYTRSLQLHSPNHHTVLRWIVAAFIIFKVSKSAAFHASPCAAWLSASALNAMSNSGKDDISGSASA